MLTLLLLVFQVLGLISSVHAVLRTRTPQGAIAWAVSLNALPVVAVPAYWVLGRSKFHGYVKAFRDDALDIQKRLEQIHMAFEPYMVDTPRAFPTYRASPSRPVTRFLSGNDVELLVDGEATYDSIARGIAAARSYVLFQFYILRPDDSGNRFRDLLVAKAKEGVAVYVLYDELGSSEITDEWVRGFTDAGIRMVPFNTRQGPDNRFQLNFHNHRKIVVVDGRVAWLGGLNVGDEYLGRDEKLSPWRDTHLRIDGPSAVVAQSVFWSDWYWATKEHIDGLNWEPHPGSDAGGADQDVIVLGTGPADTLETASLFFTAILNGARHRIWIATPYFIPDEATMVALRLALLQGLDVRIVTPARNDNWFVRHAANVYLSELSLLGARIYSYRDGFMHQKVMLVDDGLAVVGTVNFDNRSFRLNFEVSGAVADRDFARMVESMLEADLARSHEVPAFDVDSGPWWERVKARGSALLAPVL